MAQLMPLPLTVFCFSKIQIGFTLLVPAHLGSPGKRAVKRVCVCVCVCVLVLTNIIVLRIIWVPHGIWHGASQKLNPRAGFKGGGANWAVAQGLHN